jgi:hypothetical protein
MEIKSESGWKGAFWFLRLRDSCCGCEHGRGFCAAD